MWIRRPADAPSSDNALKPTPSEDVLTAKSRCISGKSLVSKVQALIVKAEDLIGRMNRYRERYVGS